MNLGSCHNDILCLLSLITVYHFTVGLQVFPESRITLWYFLNKYFTKISFFFMLLAAFKISVALSAPKDYNARSH